MTKHYIGQETVHTKKSARLCCGHGVDFARVVLSWRVEVESSELVMAVDADADADVKQKTRSQSHSQSATAGQALAPSPRPITCGRASAIHSTPSHLSPHSLN